MIRQTKIERGSLDIGNNYEDGKINVPVKLSALSTKTRFILIFITASASILALFFLAASLNSLSIPQNEQLVLPESQRVEVEGPRFSISTTVLQAILMIGAIFLTIAIIIVVRSKSTRRETVRQLLVSLAYILIYALVFIAIRLMQGPLEEGTPEVTQEAVESFPFSGVPGIDEAADVITITPPDPPAWLGFIVSIAVLLFAAGIVYYVWQMRRELKTDLGEIARTAVSDLKKGQRWDDVVIRCYRDMTEAAVRLQRLKRPEAMTASEYALRLEQAGLPSKQVQNLTHLFEKARYGNHESGSQDIQEAISCLSAIQRALEKKV